MYVQNKSAPWPPNKLGVWDPWLISCVGDCGYDGAHPYTCLRAGSDGKRGRLYSRGEGDATRSELRSIERFTRKPVFGPGRYIQQSGDSSEGVS